jgi:hypothetical protein
MLSAWHPHLLSVVRTIPQRGTLHLNAHKWERPSHLLPYRPSCDRCPALYTEERNVTWRHGKICTNRPCSVPQLSSIKERTSVLIALLHGCLGNGFHASLSLEGKLSFICFFSSSSVLCDGDLSHKPCNGTGKNTSISLLFGP